MSSYNCQRGWRQLVDRQASTANRTSCWCSTRWETLVGKILLCAFSLHVLPSLPLCPHCNSFPPLPFPLIHSYVPPLPSSPPLHSLPLPSPPLPSPPLPSPSPLDAVLSYARALVGQGAPVKAQHLYPVLATCSREGQRERLVSALRTIHDLKLPVERVM